MPYTADISRSNPACILFLIDQSGSMSEALSGQPGQRKMDQAANAVNRVLEAVSLRCSQGEEVRDYFHIGVLSYTTDDRGVPIISPVLSGTSLENPFVMISDVAENAEVEERMVRVDDGAGGLVEVSRRIPVWLHPAAYYGTPMGEALDASLQSLAAWVNSFSDSFPPIVIHITDGDATGMDPEPIAREVMSLATNDGNVLLFNIHLSGVPAMPVQYPASEEGLPDPLAVRLFRMSSSLPESTRGLAVSMDLPVTEGSRGFVFNSDMTALVQFLDIGTRGPSNLH